MKLPYFEVAAFTVNAFGGNPAGVCPLEKWLPDGMLQGIAANNNLAETAFTVARGNDFELRWFTPAVEVDLCGHATLAAARVLFSERSYAGNAIRFHTKSGALTVTCDGEILTLNFPSRPATACNAPEALLRGLGVKPKEVLKARDYLAVFDREDEVRALKPDFAELSKLDCLGIITSAPGKDCDFISRFFAPAAGINEDPVTGSSHCTLIPYWSQKLGKTKLLGRQISVRGGELFCELAGERVHIGGKAVIYLRGKIEIEEAA